MIEWIKYDPANPPERGKEYLVTEGCLIEAVEFDGYWNTSEGYAMATGDKVTHYAHINLPGEETDNETDRRR